MSEESAVPFYTVTTWMEAEDLRRFFYIATFQRSPFVLPLLAAIAFFGAFLTWRLCGFSGWPALLLLWLLMSLAALAAVLLQMEQKNKKRLARDPEGLYQTKQTMRFYAEELTVENQASGSLSRVPYQKLYQVLSAPQYLIFYYEPHLAGLLRRKDGTDTEKLEIFLQKKLGNRYRRIR